MEYRWKRVRRSLKSFRNKDEYEQKEQQLSDLMQLDADGFIDVYFADESSFSLTPNVPYAWKHKDSPILLPSKRSQNINVFGLMNIDCHFRHYSTCSTINAETVISFIDDFCLTINKMTVVVLDNAPVHRSKKFSEKIKLWQEQDLYIFFLPAYAPELNRIEDLWRFIKYKWLPFDAFLNFQNLNERLDDVLNSIGTKYVINYL
jgi:hypothetical protein